MIDLGLLKLWGLAGSAEFSLSQQPHPPVPSPPSSAPYPFKPPGLGQNRSSAAPVPASCHGFFTPDGVWVLIFVLQLKRVPIITASEKRLWHEPCSQLWPPPTLGWGGAERYSGSDPGPYLNPIPSRSTGCTHLLWRGNPPTGKTQTSLPNIKATYSANPAVSAGGQIRGSRAANR